MTSTLKDICTHYWKLNENLLVGGSRNDRTPADEFLLDLNINVPGVPGSDGKRGAEFASHAQPAFLYMAERAVTDVGEGSLSFWFACSIIAEAQGLATFGNSSLQFYNPVDGQFQVVASLYDGAYHEITQPNSASPFGKTSVVLTWKDNTEAKLYVNGALVGSVPIGVLDRSLYAGVYGLVLGHAATQGNSLMNGAGIFNVELTAVQITELYNDGNIKDYPF